MTKSKLSKPFFETFTVNEVSPGGWLKKQLEIQGHGLSGKLDKFWPDIKDSAWIGGNREGWERMPYWLDGFIPMAFLLKDSDMQARAKKYIDAIISRQEDDGWLCPCSQSERQGYDMWALFLILKVLVEWYEATKDERIEEVVYKALKSLDLHMDRATLFGWAQTRWYECLIPLFWLYERRTEDWLLSLASKLRSQGFDWVSFFETNYPYQEACERGRWSQMNHVVNNAMMLKSPALWGRVTGSGATELDKILETLDRYHGMVTGAFTGDECLAGLSPSQGTELCAVAEYMYSLEQALAVTGKPEYADRLESLAYNAYPATFDPLMQTHQYDQQVNQMQCTVPEEAVFTTNGTSSNIFGLEPNYGCCTANLSQGWPKFIKSVFMKTEKGVALTLLAPAALKTSEVFVEVTTNYPFCDSAEILVDATKGLTLTLRAPAHMKAVSLQLNGRDIPVGDGFFDVELPAGTSRLSLNLEPLVRVIPRPNNLFAVARGGLIFSLKIEEEWKKITDTSETNLFGDYQVKPLSKWNYAIDVKDLSFEVGEVGEVPFAPETSPILCKTWAKQIDWDIVQGSAAPTPRGEPFGEKERVTLIPYGCTNLRMTELPVIY